jgi:glucosamine--fructose-6-phosphate aminotransferase (isomerizing)
MLQDALTQSPTHGKLGIAHTRWATHGVPSERNAHPHISRDGLAIVHNGIIENHEELRAELQRLGYQFTSETDTEVIAHRIHHHLATVRDLFKAVRATVAELEGAYALAVVSEHDPDRIILAREGCPVVIGLGVEENFVASDVAALLPVTRRFVFLEEGDVAEIRRKSVRIIDKEGNTIERPARDSELSADAAEKGQYRHFMLKEIHEQPRTRCRSASPTAGCWKPRSVRRPRRSSSAPSTFTSSRAARAITRGRWRVISWNRSASCRAPSRSRANIAIAVRWCRRIPCS